jgi:NADPH:quinone reductase-like Zn-dependent oxidoreductase
MPAVQFHEYGGPEVLHVGDAPEVHPGPGQVRVEVRASSVNPLDWKMRAGYLAQGKPMTSPGIVGFDASGVVDEIGEGVDDVAVGDDVFGLGSATAADHALLEVDARKPASVDWAVAAAAGVAAETAIRALDLVGVTAGSTVLIDGGAGGVDAVAAQIAVARGATVIATAGADNHDYLREIGAIPVRYGAGMADRVRAVAPDGVDAVFDVAGKTPVADLLLDHRPAGAGDDRRPAGERRSGDQGADVPVQPGRGGARDQPERARSRQTGADSRVLTVKRRQPCRSPVNPCAVWDF